MKSQLPTGLVIEGNSTGSAVLRLPRIAEDLGPIKSGSLRIARRISNFMRAGYGVSAYEELQAARMVLLRVPDSSVERIVAELGGSELDFGELAFVLCDTWLTSDVLDPLKLLGSSVATLSARGSHLNHFAVEGQPAAVRQIRKLLDRNDAQSFELRPGTKELFFAADLLATALPIPLYVAAQQALRVCGLSGKPLFASLEESAHEMFRAFYAGARLNWGGPLTECSPALAELYLDAVRQKCPEVAEVIDDQLPRARRIMTRSRQEDSADSHSG